MLTSSTNAVLELATSITKLQSEKSNATFYDVATAWKRVQQFRDRVISVYYDILISLYNEQPMPGVIPPNSKANALFNHFGNNRLNGDIGNLSGVTVSLNLFYSILIVIVIKVYTYLPYRRLRQRKTDVVY